MFINSIGCVHRALQRVCVQLQVSLNSYPTQMKPFGIVTKTLGLPFRGRESFRVLFKCFCPLHFILTHKVSLALVELWHKDEQPK